MRLAIRHCRLTSRGNTAAKREERWPGSEDTLQAALRRRPHCGNPVGYCHPRLLLTSMPILIAMLMKCEWVHPSRRRTAARVPAPQGGAVYLFIVIVSGPTKTP